MLSKIKNQIRQFFEQFDRHSDQVRQSLKTTVACLFALILIKLLALPFGQWVVITILVVMTTQISIGGTTQKAKARFIGTVSGVSLAIVSLWLFGHHFIPLTLIMLLGALVFTYIAASGGPMAYAGTLGGITLALVILNSDPTIKYGLIRFLEITLGIVIALLVSKFLFPVHATKRLPHSLAFVLTACANYYQRIFREQEQDLGDITSVQTIINHLTRQQQLIEEACAEQKKKTFDKNLQQQILIKQRKIFRIIMMLHYFLLPEHTEKAQLLRASYLQAFHGQMLHAMHLLAAQATDPQLTETINVEQSLSDLQQQVEKHLVSNADYDPAYANSFVFLVKLLAHELQALQHLLRQSILSLHDR